MFTFKDKTTRTGLAAVGARQYHVIKLQKKEVGYIQENAYTDYAVYFAVKTEPTKENPAPFKWVTLKKRFSDNKEAREYVKENAKRIISTLNLYSFDF